jgi:hypothetical protein
MALLLSPAPARLQQRKFEINGHPKFDITFG